MSISFIYTVVAFRPLVWSEENAVVCRQKTVYKKKQKTKFYWQ